MKRNGNKERASKEKRRSIKVEITVQRLDGESNSMESPWSTTASQKHSQPAVIFTEKDKPEASDS
tara:strand:- start:35 stop:229 length:195 start_codon:yes stop_codon:yes gene_type:complete